MTLDDKTKKSIAALFLAATVGVGAGRLSATPSSPTVRLASMTIDPVVSLSVLVDTKVKRLQCTDANGAVTKLDGKDFPTGKSLCEAAVVFATGAKASVGLISSNLK